MFLWWQGLIGGRGDVLRAYPVSPLQIIIPNGIHMYLFNDIPGINRDSFRTESECQVHVTKPDEPHPSVPPP